MKKAEFSELARLGVRSRLREVEDYLAELFHEFPDEFSTQTPPVFTKAVEKPGGNSWPAFTAVNSNGSAAEDVPVEKKKNSTEGWTEARRRQAAERNRNRYLNAPWGSAGWHKLHDALKKMPDRTSSIAALAKTTKLNPHSINSAFRHHPELFVHEGKGRWHLVKLYAKPAAKTAKAAKPAARPTKRASKTSTKDAKWGDFQWHKIHDFLKTQDSKTATLDAIMKAAKIPSQGSAITAMNTHNDLFRRVGVGTYTLIKEDAAAHAANG